MRIACTNINNRGIELSKELINKAVFKYNGILGRAMFKLYDLGYQSSPSVFDIDDFRSILFDDFSSEINLLRDNLRGKIGIDNELMVRYAMYKTKNNEFRNVLSIYLDILSARKSLDAYSTLISKVKIPKKNNIVKIKPRLGVSGSVNNYNAIPLDSKAIWESFVLEEDEELITYNTEDIIVKEMIKNLGYSENEYLEHKNSGQPFFIAGVSQEDELSLLDIITSGKIVTDGRFGAELSKSIEDYYNDFYKTHDSRISCSKYEELIFNKSIDERIDLINKKRADFKDTPFREFYVTSNEVIFAVKTGKDKISKSYFNGNKLHLGVATLSHENRSELSKINTLCGLCGEFIHESVATERGWATEGLPISIKFGLLIGKRFKLSELNYYPIYNVYYSNNDVKSASIKPLLGNDIQVIVSDKLEVFKTLGVSSKADLFNKFLKATDVDLPFVGVNRTHYEELVADLSTALVLAECGELDYDMYCTGYNWVTDDIFYRACIEAEELFKSFGF